MLSSTIWLVSVLLPSLASAVAVTFSLSPSTLLTNPSALPPSTKATLFRHGSTITARLTRRNTFEFQDLNAGSYLFTVQCRDFAFGPLRVDVSGPTAKTMHEGHETESTVSNSASSITGQVENVEVWQTFWGNEWGNKGALIGAGTIPSRVGMDDDETSGEAVVIEIKADRAKEYYAERDGFSPLDFLKSPMILMALASLGLIVGMPYLIDSMDEETRAEFEEAQKKTPPVNPAQALQNFDLAGWMAGKQS